MKHLTVRREWIFSPQTMGTSYDNVKMTLMVVTMMMM